eukprot:316143-Amphidinium_carterae.1
MHLTTPFKRRSEANNRGWEVASIGCLGKSVPLLVFTVFSRAQSGDAWRVIPNKCAQWLSPWPC